MELAKVIEDVNERKKKIEEKYGKYYYQFLMVKQWLMEKLQIRLQIKGE